MRGVVKKMLYLNVPFSEKDEAKSKYARWDPEKKKWYATNEKYYYRFVKWIEGESVATNNVYIAVMDRECWKCKNETPVYGFAIRSKDIIDITGKTDDIEEYTGFDTVIISISSDIPEKVRKYLIENTKCEMRFSKTIQSSYFANVCTHCNAIQGDYFVYDEVDSFTGVETTMLEENPISYISFNLVNDIPLGYEAGDQIVAPSVKIFNENNIVESGISIE